MHQSKGKKHKIIIYLILLIILTTTNVKFSDKQKNYSLKINRVYVSGLSTSENLEIQNKLNSIFNQNIFILGKKEINKIINKFNIIEEFSIKKIYPSRLNIKIKPTKFRAKITKDGNQLIVGANGKLIANKLNNKKLPYIFGNFNSKEFLDFQKQIEYSKFNFDEFKTIYFFPSNRWDILMIDDTLIKLPQDDISHSLNLAYKIMTNNKFKKKKTIDLRVKNYLILK